MGDVLLCKWKLLPRQNYRTF